MFHSLPQTLCPSPILSLNISPHSHIFYKTPHNSHLLTSCHSTEAPLSLPGHPEAHWMRIPSLSLSPHQRLENLMACLIIHNSTSQIECYIAYNNEWIAIPVRSADEMENASMRDASMGMQSEKANASSAAKRRLFGKATAMLSRSADTADKKRPAKSNDTLTSTSPSLPSIKHATLIQSQNLLIVHRDNGTLCAHHLEFVKQQNIRQESGFGTEKELLMQRQLVLGPAVLLYHSMQLDAPPTLRKTNSTTSMLYSPSHQINLSLVHKISAAHEGIWIFSPNRTYYMSLHALFNTFHSNYNKLTCSDFPVSCIFTGPQKLPTTSTSATTTPSNFRKSQTSPKTPPGSPLAATSLAPVTPPPETREHYTRYLAHVVHGTSRELVTLDTKGILRVYSIHPLIRTKIIVNTLKFDSAVAFVQKHQKRIVAEATSSGGSLPPPQIELFFSHSHYLCIINGEECLLYATKIRTFLGTVHLPSEIIVRQHAEQQKRKENVQSHSNTGTQSHVNSSSESQSHAHSSNGTQSETPQSNARPPQHSSQHLPHSTMVWDSESTQNGLGIFSYDKIYRFDPPGVRECIAKWSLMPHATQLESRKQFAEFLRELGFENWFVKMYLDIMMQEGKRNEVSRAAKKKIMDLLCTRLENPSLVWSSSNSLSEQNQIMEQVQEFLSHFPLESEFWGATQQVQQHGKSATPQVSPKQVFESMTWLNLSVAPKLAQSVKLAVEQLESNKVSKGASNLRTAREKVSLLDVYSDIELNDKFDSIAPQLLVELCERYNLSNVLQLQQGDHVPQGGTSEVGTLPKLTPNNTPQNPTLQTLSPNGTPQNLSPNLLSQINTTPLISKYLTNFEPFQSQMQLAERERIKQHNQELIHGFNHLHLLVRCLFYSPHPQRLATLVRVLEQKHRQTLEEQQKTHKALDLTQKRHFELLLQKDYLKFFADIVLDILVLHNAIPHWDADLRPFAVGREALREALTASQVDTLGALMQWAHRYVDLLKLYLSCKRWTEVIELMHRHENTSTTTSAELLMMAQVLTRCYAQNHHTLLPESFKELVVREMKANNMSRMEYLDSLNRTVKGASGETVLVDTNDSSLTVEDILPLLMQGSGGGGGSEWVDV